MTNPSFGVVFRLINGLVLIFKEFAVEFPLNSRSKEIVYEVKKLHSYSIPCILRIDAAANKDYEAWAKKEMI